MCVYKLYISVCLLTLRVVGIWFFGLHRCLWSVQVTIAACSHTHARAHIAYMQTVRSVKSICEFYYFEDLRGMSMLSWTLLRLHWYNIPPTWKQRWCNYCGRNSERQFITINSGDGLPPVAPPQYLVCVCMNVFVFTCFFSCEFIILSVCLSVLIITV